jgi:hypothetical protein
MNGPSPVDRGKSGSKLHVLSDRAGTSLAVGNSAADTNAAPVDERAVFTAVVFVLTSGCASDAAALVRGHCSHGASPVHCMDTSRSLATTTSRGAR